MSEKDTHNPENKECRKNGGDRSCGSWCVGVVHICTCTPKDTNPECLHCGLLKSTCDSTDAMCVSIGHHTYKVHEFPTDIQKKCSYKSDLSEDCSGCIDPNTEGTHSGCTKQHGHVGCDVAIGKLRSTPTQGPDGGVTMEDRFKAGCNTDNISDPPSDTRWILEFIRAEITAAVRQREETLVAQITKLKAEHDVESDPSGAFSTCLACGQNGARSGEYCETDWNNHIDAVLDTIHPPLQ